MSSFLNFVFSVIRGIQEGREFYITRCQVSTILKVFLFDEELIPAEMRTQSNAEPAYLSDDAQYVLGSPIHQALAPIVAIIDGDLTYQPLDETPGNQDIGQITVSVDFPLIVGEGQRRLDAIKLALQERPELAESYIPVIFYQTVNSKRFQKNSNLSDRIIQFQPDELDSFQVSNRDRPTVLAKAVMAGVKVFNYLTEVERSSLPMRSQKLFTLSAIKNATQALLVEHEDDELTEQIQLAIRYWNAVCANIPDWNGVLQNKVSSGTIRRDYVHGHAITLAALGHLGAALISLHPKDWEAQLKKLQQIDWSRSNPKWKGRIIINNRISKSLNSVILMTAYVKKYFGLPFTLQEEELEKIFS